MKNNVIGSSAVITSFHNEQQEDDQLSDIQNKLIRYINEQPGIRYRELLRLSGLSNGVLTYHIANREIRTDNC
jgi:predicted transcriptional regulator